MNRAVPYYAINIQNDSVDPDARDPMIRHHAGPAPSSQLVRCEDLDAEPEARSELRKKCACQIAAWKIAPSGAGRARIYDALPAGCGLLVRCSGRTVDSPKEPPRE